MGIFLIFFLVGLLIGSKGLFAMVGEAIGCLAWMMLAGLATLVIAGMVIH